MPDLLPAQWSKLIFNSAINSVAAVTGLPHVALFAREERFDDLGHLVHGLIDEGVAVAAAAGVTLHDDPWAMNVLAVAPRRDRPQRLRPPAVDARGRRGAPPHRGRLHHRRDSCARPRRLGVPVPLSTAMYRLVRGREASWSLPGVGGGRMRVAIVGCGAVGSLFAAHLATLGDEVEVWAYDVVAEHVDAINANGLRLTGRADVLGSGQRAHRRRARSPRASTASSRRRRCSPRTRSRRPRTCSPTARSAACRTASATRS